MSKLFLAARLLLGLIFTVFGMNYFTPFIPMPELTPEAAEFMTAMGKTGYFFPLLKGAEVVAGLMLLSGFFVPLALVILAPIVVNIVLYNVFVMQGGYPMVILLVVLMLTVAHSVREVFLPILAPRAK